MPLSNDFREQVYNGGPDAVLELIRVTVDGLYYYYVNNTEDIVSNVSGTYNTYNRSAFKLNLPEQKVEGTPSATLNFNAGDSEIVEYLRESNSRLIIDMWLVLSSNPDEIEFGPANFESTTYTISGSLISIGLTAEPLLEVTLPGDRYTPVTFPLLWD